MNDEPVWRPEPAAAADAERLQPIERRRLGLRISFDQPLPLGIEAHRLPVVRHERLIGVITRSDLVRAFARSDADLEREVRSVVQRAVWVEPGSIAVSVRDGEATLTGPVDSDFDGELLVRAVERVPGILVVDARLSTRES